MERRLVWCCTLLTWTVLSGLTAAHGQLNLFKRRVEANEGTSYWIKESDGPWLIMCASFSGDNGLHQAGKLVMELRKKHNLKAVMYKKKFDRPETVYGMGWDVYVNEFGQPGIGRPEMKFAKEEDPTEIAVLVGDFPSLDDRQAESTLEKIKQMKPECLMLKETDETSQSMGRLRELQRQVNSNPDVKSKGPMRHAFVMANPLLPPDYFNQNTIDRLVIDLNRGVKYSLLDCPHPFSVRVATFRGETTFRISEIEDRKREEAQLLRLRKEITKSKLAEATEKAHRLTTELRKLGVEAYEFHDRYESYVCVGSFDWVLRKDDNKQDQWNEKVVQVINDYRATIESFPNMPNAVRPKTLPSLSGTGIAFDAQPLPVQVPRAGIGR